MKLVAAALLAVASLAHADTFTVRIKTKTERIPIAEITRTAGKVTVKGLPAPKLDKLGDDFVAAWKAYKMPAKVTITESIASDTGMRPQYKDHSATFTAKDALYLPAVIREFCAKRKLDVLGMSTIKFIEYDSSAEDPPGAHDRSSTHSNFRKGTKPLDFGSEGYDVFFIRAPVRSSGLGKPDGVLRVSASNPKLAVSQDFDDGLLDIATLRVYADGHVEVAVDHPGEHFASRGVRLDDDVDVSVITDGKDYKSIKISKTSPMLLEAYIVGYLEHGQFYDVTPVIDPAKLK